MKIQFESGESRHGDYGVNFLIGNGGELYAECRVPEGASDDYGYLALKADIIHQADQLGISEPLEFWYDGQEMHLAPDAAAEAEVLRW